MERSTPTAHVIDYDHDAAMTAADLREMADLLDLQGQLVRYEHRDGHTFTGKLDAVYFVARDPEGDGGVAANVIGVDGTSFHFGALTAARVVALDVQPA